MARKFITTLELRLVDSWNREVIQDTVQQEIIYYSISAEESRVHDVYDEAIMKEYLQPVRINAQVNFEPGPTKSEGGTLDSSYALKVGLHTEECRQRNLIPREGDFVEFGQIVFEVTSVQFGKPTFGQINHKLQYLLSCVPSREGQFKVDSRREDGVDNTHPVQPRPPRSLADDI